MTTPESLEVMLISPRVNEARLFAGLQLVVIDEIHAIAGTDRGAHLMSVLERLARHSRHDLQRVGLSATVGNPEAILQWLRGTSTREGQVVDPPKTATRRQLLITHRPNLALLAQDAARMAKGNKSLFFCQSRATTEAVAEYLRRAATTVFVHPVSREERQLAEERFHHGSDACIVCTSTLELGIDVGDLDKVLQAEAPDSVSSFLQRLGRTGRRSGQVANTTFFCETTEGVLQAIALVELARQGWVESITLNQRCWPVLIHQLLAMALAGNGVTLEQAWDHLSRIPDFCSIRRDEFEGLIEWMLADGGLRLASGQLVLGPKAERRFGRRHFMELFAVFTSPQSYTVQTDSGQPLGTLSQTFVDGLVNGVSAFLLGGRAWTVQHILHSERRVTVIPAPRGRQPTWGGFLPQFLGFELCQQILGIISSDEDYAYLDSHAKAVLAEQWEMLQAALEPGLEDMEEYDGEVCWWTFAGGRINATLRHAIQAVNADWKIVPDNYRLRLRGENIDEREVRRTLQLIQSDTFWADTRLWAEVAETLPSYRLSKFQPLMPTWVEREVLGSYLLDITGAKQWLMTTLGKTANK